MDTCIVANKNISNSMKPTKILFPIGFLAKFLQLISGVKDFCENQFQGRSRGFSGGISVALGTAVSVC